MPDNDASTPTDPNVARAEQLLDEAMRRNAARENDACRELARELIALAVYHELPMHYLNYGVHFLAVSDDGDGRAVEAQRGYERVDRLMGGDAWRTVEPDRSSGDRVFHARILFAAANVAFRVDDVEAGVSALKRSVGLLRAIVEEGGDGRANAGLPLAHFAASLADVQTQLSPVLATGMKIYIGQDPTDDPDFEDPRPTFRLAIETAMRQIEMDLEGASDLDERIVAWGNDAGKYCTEVGWLDDAWWFLQRAHEYAVPRHARTQATDDMHALVTTESFSGYLTAKRGQHGAAAHWFGRAIDRLEAWAAEAGVDVEADLDRWREARSQALASA